MLDVAFVLMSTLVLDVIILSFGVYMLVDRACQERVNTTLLTDTYQFMNLQDVTDKICNGKADHALVMTARAESKGHASVKLIATFTGDV